MVDRTGLKLVIFVGGGALLLLGTCTWLFLLSGSERSVSEPGAPVASAQLDSGALGVQERALDRRFGGEHERGDAPAAAPRVAAAPRPEPEQRAREQGPPPEPTPPLVLTDEQRAANAAHDALAAEATKQAAAALDDAKAQLKRACWSPAAGEGSFSFNMSYGADGKVQALGIGEPRTASAGVGQCLRAQAIALDIPPPGKKVDVAVDLAFP